jgi:hypothetical protein
VAGLRQFTFRRGAKSQRTDLFDYFDYSLELWRQYPDQAVIKYAVARTRSIGIKPANWAIFEMLLLQWSVAEPDILTYTIDVLKAYQKSGYVIDKDRISEAFGTIIKDHVHHSHGSEIAWSLWGCLLLDIKLDIDVQRKVTNFEDAVVALLYLDLCRNKLTDKQVSLIHWERLMTEAELDDRHWLLAYEALVKGWLPSYDGTNYIAKHSGFRYLRDNNVRFYDESAVQSYQVPGRYVTGLKSLSYSQATGKP